MGGNPSVRLTRPHRTIIMKLPKTKEELRRLLELRRSNAARPVKNKKKYTRNIKHKDEKDNYYEN